MVLKILFLALLALVAVNAQDESLPCPPNARMDLVILLDSSSSVGADNFVFVREFVADIVRSFNIGPDGAQIGVVRYNRDIDDLWDLDRYSDEAGLLEAVANIPYNGGGTNTGAAIQYIFEEKFNPESGRREGVPAVTLVVTDGRSNDELAEASRNLHTVSTVIALGIKGAMQVEIDMIASPSEGNMFSQIINEFDELPGILDLLVDTVCQAMEVPPETDIHCSGQLDIAFVVDSSSSVGGDNFQLIRDFLTSIVSQIETGRDLARISIARYNNWVDSRLFFNTLYDMEAILQAIAEIPYYGRGTKTAQALQVTANHHLQGYSGWREGSVPTTVIVLTDGRTQDGEFLEEYASLLRSKATRVIAIGVGRAVEAELIQIATRPHDENVIIVTDFTDLDAETMAVVDRICDTITDVNECLVDNGGCEHRCINTYRSFYCECNQGFTLDENSLTCSDVDECLNNNGGCDHVCRNFDGGYECSCNEGYILTGDRHTCVEDSCFENTDCDHICNNIVAGDYFCTCRPGYSLNADERSCDDINECAINNGNCEAFCNNTLGSYSCQCPEGYGLRPDGRTCGVQCFTCNRALSNEDCLDTTVCQPNQLSCQTTTRRENEVLYISKGCKQTEACANNFIQNPRTAWSPTQCNVDPNGASVCRCCCHESLCNFEGDCTISDTIDIECPNPYEIFDLTSGPNITCSTPPPGPYMIGAMCRVQCPPGYQTVTGSSELVCTQEPRTVNGFWNGEIGECGDINECLVDNGGCSHGCRNLNGSFECYCPEVLPCQDQPIDLFFILDSSSSVGQTNFDIMISFVASLTGTFPVNQDEVRVGLLTYNKQTTKRFDFKDVVDEEDFLQRLDEIEYSGRGTRTARAIRTATRECFGEDRGRRPDVPLAVVVITDGRSNDHRNIPEVSARLHAMATEVLAIGVGARVNENELLQIADGDASNYRMVDDFSGLNEEIMNLIGDRFCTEPVEQQELVSDGLNCDFDECSIDNGGCSHNCTNTVGSFYCSCPEGMSIIDDRVTCDPDECLIDNGDCDQACINTFGSRNCLCANEQMLVDETSCVDYNECLDENGGCSHGCEDLDPGFRCTCPEGYLLGQDGEECEPDSCFGQEPPFVCDQICDNIPGGSYQCRCEDGYVLQDDGHNCTETNECSFANGGCEHTCVNTPGSYYCECPAGYGLREDGKTCGIMCYACQNVLSNEDCSTSVVCPVSQEACFTTMRTRDSVTSITKGCQQDLACINNMIQNPRAHGEGPSQCNTNEQNSKCECCCFDSLCNADLCPYDFVLPGCPIFERDDVVFTGVQDENTVSAGGYAQVVCGEGFTHEQGSAGLTQLNCVYNFVNQTAAWDGLPSDLDVCVDIDECAINNGSCVAPAMCVNFPGSYECVCPDEPDDYELFDGIICERDECSDPDQGGCSHNCTNTIGSYVCFCPPRYSLVEDGLTCDYDECQDANGGCAEQCVNTLGGYECRCNNPGTVIGPDGHTCEDINECETDNGGCSHICTNLVPGYQCSCPEDQLLNPDGFTCRDNPCFINNGGCEHICTVLEEGYRCECRQGYVLLEDGSCQDIDECAVNNGGCQYNCTNFDGGYECLCPDGQGLHPNGRTCGRACYACNGAATNEECNSQPIEICPMDADACENQVRVHQDKKLIFKRCKQGLSCSNNFIQNPREAFMPSQCNGDNANDVCRCCCTGHLCNFNEKPCQSARPCNLRTADVTIVLDSSSSVKYDNFQKMKSFTKSLFLSFNLGEGQVHSALIRYNNRVDERFNLADSNAPDDVADAVDMVPYDGRGTHTGRALRYVRDNILKVANGQRLDVPQIVITITDGMSQDNVLDPSVELRNDGVITFAVGIGNLDQTQLNEIAGDPDRVFIAEDFDALGGLVLMEIQEAVCHDVNECLTDNGGCSHECLNLPGSYQCACPEELRLDADGRKCVGGPGRSFVDECAENNGGCQHNCVNTLEGHNCTCGDGFTLQEDGRTCSDLNECDDSECSHGCVNLEGGYFCECPEDHEMSEDLLTCTPRPGPADCPFGFLALGHSCIRSGPIGNYNEANEGCAVAGARLAKIADEGVRLIIGRAYSGPHYLGLTDRGEEGVWINSDGTVFTYENGWGDGEPGAGDCGYLDQYLKASPCSRTRNSLCEIPREEGFVVFPRTWPNGAQGKLYMPTDVNTVLVTFPEDVESFGPWFGSVVTRRSAREFVVHQTDNERQSSTGQVEFTVNMRQRFPDYEVVVTPFVL